MGTTKRKQTAGPRCLRRPVIDTDQAVYVKAIRTHLRNGNRKYAYRIVLHAVTHFPENALILSYCGYLKAAVDKKYRSGLEDCQKALEVFKPENPFSAELAYPVLYLNLGRACIAAGKRKEAIEAFESGLRHDSGNGELLMEMQLIGMRKWSPMPFLSRSNPLNKYIGMLMRNPSR